jgi:hypothetical protein
VSQGGCAYGKSLFLVHREHVPWEQREREQGTARAAEGLLRLSRPLARRGGPLAEHEKEICFLVQKTNSDFGS